MKKVFIFLFLFLLLETAKSQPSKIMQIQFDFGGERDDITCLISSPRGEILVAGRKIPFYNAPGDLWRVGIAMFDKNGSIIWNKILDDSSSGIWTKAAINSPDSSFVIGTDRGVKKISYNGDIIGILYKHYRGDYDRFTLAGNNNFLIATKAQQTGGALFSTKLSWNGDSLVSWNLLDEVRVFNTEIYQNNFLVFGIFPGGTNSNVSGRVSLYSLEGTIIWSDTIHDCSRFFGTVDEFGNIYASGNFGNPYAPPPNSRGYYKTVKWSLDGTRQWERSWDGDFPAQYNFGGWVDGVIPYPGGGCIVVGSLTQPNNRSNPNYTDFGAIAYDSNGEVRWKMRFQAYPGWWRNDLWAATWDNEGYLWLVGSAVENDTKYHRYIFLTKWFVPGVTGVEPQTAPKGYELHQNYPNPFNPTTTISFAIPQRAHVTLKVFDVLGKEVAMLVDEEKEPGEYSVNFDASGLPSGIYFYKIKAGEFTETKKMILMK